MKPYKPTWLSHTLLHSLSHPSNPSEAQIKNGSSSLNKNVKIIVDPEVAEESVFSIQLVHDVL